MEFTTRVKNIYSEVLLCGKTAALHVGCAWFGHWIADAKRGFQHNVRQLLKGSKKGGKHNPCGNFQKRCVPFSLLPRKQPTGGSIPRVKPAEREGNPSLPSSFPSFLIPSSIPIFLYSSLSVPLFPLPILLSSTFSISLTFFILSTFPFPSFYNYFFFSFLHSLGWSNQGWDGCSM